MKLISLNIEGTKHLERVLPFLERENADVICLQELFEKDAPGIAERLNMTYVFSPMLLGRYKQANGESWEKFGIAIFSRAQISNANSKSYWSPRNELQRFDNTDVHTKHRTERHVLLSGEIPHEDSLFTVATTHFTWTPDGATDDYQKADAEALLGLLAKMPQVVLCGDFNVPRGYNPIYEKFVEKYTDAIPASYVSSLNLELHRLGKDPVESKNLARFMVDYIFLSSAYRAENVRLESGVSDHMAVVADILPT